MVDKADWRAMEAVERSRMDSIIEMLEAGGVRAAPEVGKRKPRRNVGIVEIKATRRASVGRNKLIRTNPDQAEETQEGVKSPTTLRALKSRK